MWHGVEGWAQAEVMTDDRGKHALIESSQGKYVGYRECTDRNHHKSHYGTWRICPSALPLVYRRVSAMQRTLEDAQCRGHVEALWRAIGAVTA